MGVWWTEMRALGVGGPLATPATRSSLQFGDVGGVGRHARRSSSDTGRVDAIGFH